MANEQEHEARDGLVWGEGETSFETKSGEWRCVNIRCKRSSEEYTCFELERYFDQAIGVQRSKWISTSVEGRDYALVCRCPACGGDYWFHISKGQATQIKKWRKRRLKETEGWYINSKKH